MPKIKTILISLIFVSIGILLGHYESMAQDVMSKGRSILNHRKMRFFRFSNDERGKISIIKKKDTLTYLVSTDTFVENQYELSKSLPLDPIKIHKNQKVLITFRAKSLSSELETNEAKVRWLINISDRIKDRIINVISLSNHWKTYYIATQINRSVSPKQFAVAMQFGFSKQKFLIKDIDIMVFDKDIPLMDLPKTTITYKGMEPDATWRIEAKKRIEKYRKGDFCLQLKKDGKPLSGITVKIKQVDHDFLWGAAIRTRDIVDKPMVQNKLRQAFNIVVFENDLKIKKFDKRIPAEAVLKCIDQLREKDFKIKGHVLVWPGFRYLTPVFKKNKDNPKKVKNLIQRHIKNIASKTKGRIDIWDVVNEAYSNRDLQTITGSEDILYQAFCTLEKIDLSAKKYVNEFGIISKGGLNVKKQQWYYDFIKRIDDHTKGKVDGIGIQSHIGTDLTPPKTVYEILDLYANLNKEISISEFTLDISDKKLREKYTRDFMTIAFSHPSVSSFLFWGYKGDCDDKVDVFNENWETGSMGKAFFALTQKEWNTSVIDTTDNNGKIKGRGFYGRYEYSYVYKNKVHKGYFSVAPEDDNQVECNIP